MPCEWTDKVFNVKPEDFESLAVEIFRFQFTNNQVYNQYCTALQVDPSSVRSLNQLPFLPIGFFKTHTVTTTSFEPAVIFESSGTSGLATSRHYIKQTGIYEKSLNRCFKQFYGEARDYCILGLLPSYLERENSSLVYMVKQLMDEGNHPRNGFYLAEFDKLAESLKELEATAQKTLLFGVSFALIDYAKKHKMPLRHTTIIETGGMKGRQKEIVRQELHEHLKASFGLSSIHSEYGMTELLSQAYSTGNGIFQTPAWMKVLVRDEDDPLSLTSTNNSRGAINVIDLANIYSCSFIATDDVGKLHDKNRFEVSGRMDNSDLRGCSLMVQAADQV